MWVGLKMCLATSWDQPTPTTALGCEVYLTTKGKLVNTIERFHIYLETKLNNQIDRYAVQSNAFSKP
jgi:protein involved in temperature-dependent protein secretion